MECLGLIVILLGRKNKQFKIKVMIALILIGIGITSGLLGWSFWNVFRNNHNQ
jgi:hypothetical protein